MTSAAIKLPVPDPDEDIGDAPIASPALGYSILANLGDEKQITVQCYVDSADPVVAIHAKIDKAMAVIDRQKAVYRRRDLVAEVEKMERARRQLHEDLDRLEQEYEKNQDALTGQIAANVKRMTDISNAAYGKGRSGPVGGDASEVNALKRGNEQLVEQQNKAKADREAARSNIAVSVGRYDEEIDKAKAKIAECDALIGTDG